jgi:hypothetical protein
MPCPVWHLYVLNIRSIITTRIFLKSSRFDLNLSNLCFKHPLKFFFVFLTDHSHQNPTN